MHTKKYTHTKQTYINSTERERERERKKERESDQRENDNRGLTPWHVFTPVCLSEERRTPQPLSHAYAMVVPKGVHHRHTQAERGDAYLGRRIEYIEGCTAFAGAGARC